MKSIFAILLLIGLTTQTLNAQQQSTCTSIDHSTLDFWVGKWNVSWDGGSGTNEITKEYDGCVIRENFKGSNLKGMSISSYVPAEGVWRQIWVDEQNGFLDLVGKSDGTNYIFHTTPDTVTPNIQLQMVFSKIQKDSFVWTWQRTENSGESWQDLWQINYTRAD